MRTRFFFPLRAMADDEQAIDDVNAAFTDKKKKKKKELEEPITKKSVSFEGLAAEPEPELDPANMFADLKKKKKKSKKVEIDVPETESHDSPAATDVRPTNPGRTCRSSRHVRRSQKEKEKEEG
jgi:hypothetical protein